MGDKHYLTAAEARERMLASITPKNRVYKAISELANEGLNTLHWSFYDMDLAVKSAIVETLVLDGYQVDFEEDPGSFNATISW